MGGAQAIGWLVGVGAQIGRVVVISSSSQVAWGKKEDRPPGTVADRVDDMDMHVGSMGCCVYGR